SSGTSGTGCSSGPTRRKSARRRRASSFVATPPRDVDASPPPLARASRQEEAGCGDSAQLGPGAHCDRAVKKKRARPLERALRYCHRLAIGRRLHSVWRCRGPVRPSNRSLGLVLITLCWPRDPVLSNISYSTVVIVRLGSVFLRFPSVVL